ncbi:MAG: 1-acyl-sn-glycerol-3-phosphate acyltransferase [candidate division KSB1 bacterium]|nr:1-acyl-sn-glycerol-3-phosphate acyltransferase [candidate division KSB1 bacterium]
MARREGRRVPRWLERLIFWLREGLYWSGLYAFKLFGRIYNRAEVYGVENMPRTGPFVAVVNHQSHMDVIASALCVRRRVHVMVKDSLFKIPILGQWMRLVYMFPVRRGALDRRAFERALGVLRQGDVLFIAPEGTRRRRWDEPPPKPRTGFVRMVQAVRCPVVPVAIWGTNRVLPPHSLFPLPRKIRVKVGAPIWLPEIGEGGDRREELQRQAEYVMAKVYELWQELDALARRV